MYQRVLAAACILLSLGGRGWAQDLETKRQTPVQETTSPAAQPAPADDAAGKVQSANNMKQLALAIHNYHDTYRQFPPAYSTDQEGKPLLSWRVFVLPFLDQMDLHKQFHLDEPWDSPHNKPLVAKMPDVFRSPNSKAEAGMTNYLGVSGPQGIFPGREKVAMRDVRDGTSNTLMTVEVSDQSAVIWTRPDDFVPDAKEPKKGLLGLRKGGFHAGFADGSVYFLKETIDDHTLNALLTRANGEMFDLAPFLPAGPPPRVRVPTRPPMPALRLRRPAQAPATGGRDAAIAEIKNLGGKFLAKGFKSSWSPDGTQLVFGRGVPSGAGDDAEGLAILDVKTEKVTPLVSPGKDPAWSPGDGTMIAYVTGYGDVEELWVIESTGGTPRKVADGGFPTWSGDGKTLFFQSRKLGKLMAVQVGAEKSEPTALMDLAWWYPAVSADGKRVAYRAGNQLVMADVSTGKVGENWFFPGGGAGFLGGWSPDGKRIGFGGYGLGDPVGLWFVEVDTGRCARMATGPFTMADWTRDGKKIALDLRTREGNEIWMIESAAIDRLPYAELPTTRYNIPAGGVNELLAFIRSVKNFQPASELQKTVHMQQAPIVLKVAAQRILQLEQDEWSPAYQTALSVLLEDRIRTIAESPPDQRRVTIEALKMFVKGKLARKLERGDVSLALSAAQALENTDSRDLAVEAYRSFAELAGTSPDEEIASMARLMAGAARRLELVGKPLALAGTRVDGAAFDWTAYRGKVVLVCFWATSSEPFRAELPDVKRLYEQYHDRGFDVVGISLDVEQAALEEFLQKEQFPWATVHDKSAAGQHPLAELYGVVAIPTALLVDKEGIVVSLRAHGDALKNHLEKLLGVPADQ